MIELSLIVIITAPYSEGSSFGVKSEASSSIIDSLPTGSSITDFHHIPRSSSSTPSTCPSPRSKNPSPSPLSSPSSAPFPSSNSSTSPSSCSPSFLSSSCSSPSSSPSSSAQSPSSPWSSTLSSGYSSSSKSHPSPSYPYWNYSRGKDSHRTYLSSECCTEPSTRKANRSPFPFEKQLCAIRIKSIRPSLREYYPSLSVKPKMKQKDYSR